MSNFSFGTTPNFGEPKTNLPTSNFDTPPGAPGGFATTGPSPTHQGFGNAVRAATAVLDFGIFGAAQAAAAPANALPALACFGQPAASATGQYLQPSLENSLPTNFLFSQNPSTSQNLKLGTTTSTDGWFGKPAMPATTEPFRGLGGCASIPKVGDTKEPVKVKETQVPNEIAESVDSLKDHIKRQRTLASDIGCTTTKPKSVTAEITNLHRVLQEMSNSVGTNYNDIKLLRNEIYKAIQTAAMAERTSDMPAGLQFEKTTPFEYFQSLVTKYEQDITAFQQQISLVESRMRALTKPVKIAPEDLKRGLRQINESFVALANCVKDIHENVEKQKKLYLQLRKYRLHDTTNVFAELEKRKPTKPDSTKKKGDHSHITSGPTPFH